MMDYQKTLDYIHSRPRSLSAKPSLARITDLLARLGNPQKKLKFVHIAGTNGKGSVAALIASALRRAGCNTGLFTSPYLQDFRERIQLNGELISQKDLITSTEQVKSVEDERAALGLEPVNEFELVTAIAFLYFQGCDIVVLETGLGGRFDPTNAIDPPEVAVITHIAMDHMATLGDTLDKIAYQKAGIIKTGSEVVIAPNEKTAIDILAAQCRSQGVVPVFASFDMIKAFELTDRGTSFSAFDQSFSLRLLGRHQLANALTAYLALKALQSRGFAISENDIINGLSDTNWPARLEIISRKPMILLDCAHNPDGAAVLKEALDSIFAGKSVIAVMGMMSDKDWQSCVDIIAPCCRKIFAATSDTPRSLPTETLAKYVERFCPSQPFDTLEAAIDRALQVQKDNEIFLVCGSVIMAGQARTILQAKN